MDFIYELNFNLYKNAMSTVSSDIHLNEEDLEDDNKGEFLSRYTIVLDDEDSSLLDCETGSDSEELPRKKRNKKFIGNESILSIYHRKMTELGDVGFQLWAGAFLLSDFIINEKEQFKDVVIFELGCGVGFLAILLGMLQHKQSFVTDRADIIPMAQKNFKTNEHLISNADHSSVQIKPFDWILGDRNFDIERGWWSEQDKRELAESPVYYVAADVIYDDNLTSILFSSLSQIMKVGDDRLYIAIEKRFNFSITELSLIAHGYRRLINIIGDKNIDDIEQVTYCVNGKECFFKGSRMYINFPQRVMNYNRTKYLELWDVRLVMKN